MSYLNLSRVPRSPAVDDQRGESGPGVLTVAERR
ncbi:MAG: hypothetical protein QOF44_1706, partial [Streptomyces sp.]|nr:hypothetical protein [Streptomyces sp.]